MVNYLFRILWLNRINVRSGTTAEIALSGYREKRSLQSFLMCARIFSGITVPGQIH